MAAKKNMKLTPLAAAETHVDWINFFHVQVGKVMLNTT